MRALAAVDAEAFVQSATQHGVLPLVIDRLENVEAAPPVLLARLSERATADAAADLVREVELRRLLERLDEASAGALVIKGAHLAYSHYARPDLRPRLDTDLIVPLARKRAAHDVLIALGYEAAGQMSGDLVAYQAAYEKRHDGLVVHSVDLHWKIANPQVFASALTYEELAETAVPLDRLSPAARGLSTVHALLLACTHRVAHHDDSNRLIWLYDIDLLARAMAASDWQQFVDLAADRKMVAVCRRSLEQTTKWFRTAVPDRVWKDPRFQAVDGRAFGGLSTSPAPCQRHRQRRPRAAHLGSAVASLAGTLLSAGRLHAERVRAGEPVAAGLPLRPTTVARRAEMARASGRALIGEGRGGRRQRRG